MILEDFVMLGTTVPEPNKTDGRVFVCSAGVSQEYRSLIRIYPLAQRDVPTRWGMYRVRLERNLRDSRDESFQVAGDRRPGSHEHINAGFEIVRAKLPGRQHAELLSQYVVGSIQEANEKRLSLAIVQPQEMQVIFEENPASAPKPQYVLFDAGDDDGASGAKRFQWMPRIHFYDDGGVHNLMLRDWGSFELQRKHGPEYFVQNLESALNLTSSSSLLVGNMNNQRTSWLVISVLNGLRSNTDTLF